MKTVLTLAAILIAGSISAQEYTFRVLINKGQNEIRAGNEWLPVRVGATLNATDELRVSRNAYIGLVHETGKPLEVKEAGTYRVSELASKIKKGSSVLLQYADFILSSTPEKSNNLTATGSVHRGTDQIYLLLPDAKQAVVYGDEIYIGWLKDDRTSDYVVRFNSMFGDELDKLEVRDTMVSVDLAGRKLGNEDNILIEVHARGDEHRRSESCMIKKLSEADKGRIRASLSTLGDLTGEETALNQLVLANFYERHLLLIDAATAYQRAVKLMPTVPAFREAYEAFLLRNGLLQK